MVAPQSLLQAVTSLCHVMSCDITSRETHLEAAIAFLMAKKTLLARNSGGSPMALRRREEKGEGETQTHSHQEAIKADRKQTESTTPVVPPLVPAAPPSLPSHSLLLSTYDGDENGHSAKAAS